MSDFLEQQQQPFGEPGKPLKREHDSTDDFEHVEHELHNNQQQQQQPVLPAAQQLLDLEPPQPHNLQDGLLSRTDLLDTSVPAAASGGALEADLQPVPATPPPSANSEKFIEGARGQAEATPFGIAPPAPAAADELEARLREQIRDSKAATMAFMQAEKSTHGIAKSFDDDDAEEEEEEEELSQDSARQAGPPPPAVPSHANVAAAGDADDESLKGRSNPAYDSEDDEDNTRSEPSEPIFKKTPDANLLDLDNNDELEEFDVKDRHLPPSELYAYSSGDFVQDIKAATLPEPEKSPELDFVKDEIIVHETKISKPEHEPWNVLEKTGAEKFEEKHVLNDEPPSKPLPPLPKEAEHDLFDDFAPESNNYNSSNEFLLAESKSKGQLSGGETGDSEFESEPEPSPAKVAPKPAPVRPELGDAAERKVFCAKPDTSKKSNQVTPGALFSDLGIDAWFNPERLNPKVASLIYWRDPKKSGIVFGAALGVLLSLAYFSLISVIAYISLLTLTGTVAFRIYKTVQQAIQKTSDGHPFKDLLDLDLALPTEKVHEVADIAVANVNAALSELRRLFLVEDIVDSLKFGILLWSLTYLGAWFNGMTLIIIGVVALFTLPKVYETNKTQIDANLALVQARINEITAKVKAAVPIGSKKAEPAKEE